MTSRAIAARYFLAGVVGAAAATLDLERFMGVPITGYLVALAVGIPTYVCATASTPVAVGMLAAGMSPGAVLVFLLAGPATNVASFVVLGRELGRRGLRVYLAGIAIGSVAFGLVFDLAFGQDFRGGGSGCDGASTASRPSRSRPRWSLGCSCSRAGSASGGSSGASSLAEVAPRHIAANDPL